LPDPCAGLASAPTFRSIRCRFDAFDTSVNALGDVTPRAPALRTRVAKANGLVRSADTSCGAGDRRHAKKALKATFKQLGRLRALLALKASNGIPGRDALLATADGLRTDVRTLKSAVSCPTDS
jgi:hypothetical protein